MGFKYFGILAGVAFCASGIAQLGIGALTSYASGTCHLVPHALQHAYKVIDNAGETDQPIGTETLECSVGRWDEISYYQLISYIFMFIIPTYDTYAEKVHFEEMRKVFQRSRRLSHRSHYEKRGDGGGGGKRSGRQVAVGYQAEAAEDQQAVGDERKPEV
jgi:hypothetical protein